LDINNILIGVKCACGKTHYCDIEHVYIEKSAITRLMTLCEQNKKILIVADENTYSAAGKKAENALECKAHIVSTDYPPRTDNTDESYVFSFGNRTTVRTVK
jgi:hypothetical protein